VIDPGTSGKKRDEDKNMAFDGGGNGTSWRTGRVSGLQKEGWFAHGRRRKIGRRWALHGYIWGGGKINIYAWSFAAGKIRLLDASHNQRSHQSYVGKKEEFLNTKVKDKSLALFEGGQRSNLFCEGKGPNGVTGEKFGGFGKKVEDEFDELRIGSPRFNKRRRLTEAWEKKGDSQEKTGGGSFRHGGGGGSQRAQRGQESKEVHRITERGRGQGRAPGGILHQTGRREILSIKMWCYTQGVGEGASYPPDGEN